MKAPAFFQSLGVKLKTLFDSVKNAVPNLFHKKEKKDLEPYNLDEDQEKLIEQDKEHRKKIKLISTIITSVITFSVVTTVLVFYVTKKNSYSENKSVESVEPQKIEFFKEKGGKELAESLVLPETEIIPYPLANKQRSKYTVDEAKELMPSFENIDIWSLRKKRKEKLETVFNAVK